MMKKMLTAICILTVCICALCACTSKSDNTVPSQNAAPPSASDSTGDIAASPGAVTPSPDAAIPALPAAEEVFEIQEQYAPVFKSISEKLDEQRGDADVSVIIPSVSICAEQKSESGNTYLCKVRYVILSSTLQDGTASVSSSYVNPALAKVTVDASGDVTTELYDGTEPSSRNKFDDVISGMCGNDTELAADFYDGSFTAVTPSISEMISTYCADAGIGHIAHYQGGDAGAEDYIAKVQRAEHLADTEIQSEDMTAITEYLENYFAEVLSENGDVFNSLEVISITDKTEYEIWSLALDPEVYGYRAIQVVCNADINEGTGYGSWEKSGKKTFIYYFEKASEDSIWTLRDAG